MIARLRRWLGYNPARELSLMGHAKRRDYVLSTARKLREEMGMAPDRRLGA